MKLKMATKRLLIILSIFALILSMSACGTENSVQDDTAAVETEDNTAVTQETETATPEHVINLDGLNEIESKDTFELKITSKEVIRDAVSGISLAGNDYLAISIENNTGASIANYTYYIIGYDSNNGLVRLGDGTASLASDGYVVAYGPEEDSVYNAGETIEGYIACDADGFVGVEAIVASYTDLYGNTITNPIADEWLKSVELDKVTVLD